ncbi:MAG: thiol-disulfide oxidoreductase DCC family protein [Nitrospinales bacterium]
MAQLKKPLLIYDGDCNFCLRWISRWRPVTQDRVDYAPSQDVANDFPEIPPDRFEASVLLVDLDGNIYEGAEAVFRALAYAPRKNRALWIYQNVPGFAWMSERFYRFVAENRRLFSTLTRWL